MSILRGARKVVIQDAQFNAYDNRVTNASQPVANFGTITPESVLHILQSHSAIAGLLNASEQFDVPKCDPETRASVIETITNWVQAGTSSSSSSMLWLHGPAGVGKSAVAQAVALLLEQEEDLAASFFFSRTAPGRNNGNMLIVTLAYQIAMNFPATRTYIAKKYQAQSGHLYPIQSSSNPKTYR
ncbi:hypothetical protein BDZ97DRAFT_270611 [Flammula alnicola]|nr:hypothetical protein BDZ97DRAFT_270611 [Flammula alnicola]